MADKKKDSEVSGKEIVEGFVWVARALRFIRAEGIVGNFRRRASLGFFELLHLDVVHRMRRLGMALETAHSNEQELTHAGELAIEFCSACALLMGRVIEVEQNEIHCCLKVIVKGPKGLPLLRTFARSEPTDDREDISEGTPLASNTVWNAFSGSNDGHNNWQRMNCFCCNDLTEHASEFDNGRSNWDRFYKSKLTFPLRFVDKQRPQVFETIGFLEFDSKKGAFVGMPCCYDYVKDAASYRCKLDKCTVFQVGAIIADTLSICLRPYYSKGTRKLVDKEDTFID